MNTSKHIADDWEEVDGDDFSVVSVPRSEDPVNINPSGSSSCSHGSLVSINTLTDDPVNERKDHGRDNDTPVQMARPDAVTPASDERGEAQDREMQDDEVERRGLDTKDVLEPEDPHIRSLYDFSINTTLIKLIEEIVDIIDGDDGPRKSRTTNIESRCQALLMHLRRLSPILEGYAKHCAPGRTNSDFCLDPDLESWLSNLTAEMHALKAALQKEGVDNLHDASGFEKALASFTNQMDELMPVIQEDYNDSHTAGMNFLSLYENDQSSSTKAADTSADQQEQTQKENDLRHLRRELYELKDQVANCVTAIETHQQDKAGSGAGGDFSLLTGIASSYRFVKSSLDTMLSNQASDWTDHSLHGGMTYAEFRDLSPDTIRTLHLQLKDAVKDVAEELYRTRSLRYMNDPDNLLEQDGKTLLLSDALLNELYAMEEMLIAIFRLRKPSTSAKEGR